MDHHSYAKLRGYRKWTLDQKRKLVAARINYDEIFSKKSSNYMDSWKRIMTAAKLNDFNVCFVRKQWANLLARYKAYKRTRLRQLGKNGELTEQVIREISEEWEFFYPIHSFMSRKTTNFHSYAQTPRPVANNSNHNTSHNNGGETTQITPNTDHDFYSKSACQEEIDNKKESTENNVPPPNAITSNSITEPKCIIEPIESPTVSVPSPKKAKKKKRKKKRKPSEKDKYYRHRRHYNRRNERRFDALLNVFGQIIKSHYPNVDTSGLGTQTRAASTEDEEMISTMSMSSTASESNYTATAASEESDF